jgi:two-component system cell cycle sensor histidine kinase/response regulator CckA
MVSAVGAQPRFRQRAGYLVAVAAAALAVAAHVALYGRYGTSLDAVFLVMVGVITWYGGFGSGLLALALIALGVLLAPPAGTSAAGAVEVLVFGVSGFALSGLIASMLNARRRAEAASVQVTFLAEVSDVLAKSLDYRATLTAAARLAVPRLADWCAVDVVDAEGRLRRLAIHHRDPAKVDAVWAMSHRYREMAEDPVPQVIRSAQSQVIADIPDELLRRFARDEAHLQALRAFRLSSLMIVPLVARGRTLGAITFVTAESGRQYGSADLVMAELLAKRAAIAVDNARLYREAEEALRDKARSLAILDTVFRGAPIGLAFVDRELRFVRVNEAFAAMTGGSVDAHLGRTVPQVLGPEAPVGSAPFEAVFGTGHPVLEQETVRPPRGDETQPRVYLASFYPVSDASGGVEWVGCIVSDVTERRRAAALVAQTERMQAIARVAGGVAHEVNNMMTVITGFSGFLEASLPPDDPRSADVTEIRRAADRAAGITRQLLAYSRQQLLQPTPLDLNVLVQQNLPVLERLLGTDVSVEVNLVDGSAPVRADQAQLEQVLVNLTLNARDAMDGRGILRITTDTVTVAEDAPEPKTAVRMAPGRYLRLTVADTGHGMDAATQARAFEPFFTTKPTGQGSGLGLATVYGIVKQSGGYIWVSSELGRGTTFRIYLPESGGAPPELPRPPVRSVPRGVETILIVEDEAAVRRMASRALAGQGYAILEAGNGAEALELLADGSIRVDLVLSDLVMPVLNGRELAERLAVDRPDIRVLLMSGYSDDDIVRRGLLRPGAPFLQKPFLPADLSRKVRDVLDGR